MSKIALALAKANERTGNTAVPFLAAPSAVPDHTAMKRLKKARQRQRCWVMVLVLALAAVAFVLWEEIQEVRAVAASDELTSESPSEMTLSSSDPFHLPAEGGRASSGSTHLPAPLAEHAAIVASLVITGVLPGEYPRLLYQDRIIAVGEVISGELVFAGVRDGRLFFRDQRGALYPRSY